MRYFHRTSLPIGAVLDEADRFLGGMLARQSVDTHERTFSGSIGTISVAARAEGGHYTRVTVWTDQVGESEADKVSKRFLTIVHKRAEPGHVARGAY